METSDNKTIYINHVENEIIISSINGIAVAKYLVSKYPFRLKKIVLDSKYEILINAR